MPIYEFECESCGVRFEMLASVDTSTETCIECGAAGAPRRMSMFGVTTRQPTASQRRRMEDKRGTNRDGARTRWGESLARGRASGRVDKGPKKPSD